MGNLIREAALGPIRTLEISSIETIDIEQVNIENLLIGTSWLFFY
jgi:hypothetical protein